MHRIDTAGNVGGMFVPPNPLAGQPAVVVDSAWLNDMQEQIMAVLIAAGVAPTKGRAHDLLDAINEIITGDFPGFVASFNTRTGAVTLTAADVDGALGYTPLNKAGDTVSGNLSVVGVFEAATAPGDHGVRIRAPADESASILQWTNHEGSAQWGTLAAVAPGQPLQMNGHAIATIDSPVFTGDPQVPTAAPGTDTEQAASTAFAMQAAGWMPGDFKFGHASAPAAGWLLCDGSAHSRATYAALFAVVGVEYGPGDGATTFNVPPGGYFLRAIDPTAAVDGARAAGSIEQDQVGAHPTGILVSTGSGEVGDLGQGARTGSAAAQRMHTDSLSGGEQQILAGSGETRPKNMAQYLFIKT